MEVRTKISKGGRIVVPRNFRKALHLKEGEDIILRLDKNEVQLFSLQQAIKKAQDKVQSYNTSQKSLSEALLNMRKEEKKYE